ncbi:MAG: shikimate dehydrogenase [Armatimonadetes bacterium]|nr:shikimate dehydrogenase [Armatimonadota bacterium]
MERFVFLIHPLDMRDVIRYEPQAANKRETLVKKVLEWMPSNIVSHVTGIESATGKRAEGWFSLVPLLPSQFVDFPREQVYEKVLAAARLGHANGARIVGLGGYTSVVGDAGQTLADRLEGKIAVTSGNSYTIATSLQGALEGARRLGMNLEDCRAAVVGASGSIGSVCARLIARKVKHMTLVARNAGRLRNVAEVIRAECGKVCDIETEIAPGVRDSDIVITATSSTGNIIRPDDLKPGALVCDVSLPHDVCREVATARPDVLVIEGGLAEVPGKNPDFGFDFGYPQGVSLACMAETIILALEGRYENYTLGRGIKIEQVEEISRLADKHGFKLAGLRSFDRVVTDDEIGAVREAARLRRKGVPPVYSFREGVV